MSDPENVLMTKIGKGVVERTEVETNYRGTMPFDDGDEVVVMRKDDLTNMIQNADALTFRKPVREMPEDFYMASKTKYPMPDEIFYIHSDKEMVAIPIRLFLDRNFYTTDPKRYIAVRWVSIEEALEEEDPETGERND